MVLQVRTAGNELDYGSFALQYNGLSLPGSRAELERTSFGGPPGTPGSGFSVTSKYAWDLPGDYAGPFSIGFKASDVSVSLDAIALDVGFVPEPSTWALLGSGLGAWIVASRRRKA